MVMVVKTGVVHFSLGESFGQLITDIAREKAWHNCRRDSGVLMLVEGLSVTADQARLVVDGKMKFITNEDHETVRLVEDDWSPPDFEALEKEIGQHIADAENAIMRAEKGQLFIGERDTECIRTEIRDIRELIKMNIWKARTKAAALNTWVLGIHNANRERLREITMDKKEKKRGTADGETDVMEMIKADAKARIASMPLDPETRDRMLRLVDSQGEEAEIKVDSEFDSDTGWLDREGHYYGCELGLHINLAEKLVRRFFPERVKEGQLLNGERTLEELGWMKSTGGIWYETELPPTAAQKFTFKRWSKKHTVRKYHARSDY